MSSRFCPEKPGLQHHTLTTKGCPHCGISFTVQSEQKLQVVSLLDSDDENHLEPLSPIIASQNTPPSAQPVRKPSNNRYGLFENKNQVEEARSANFATAKRTASVNRVPTMKQGGFGLGTYQNTIKSQRLTILDIYIGPQGQKPSEYKKLDPISIMFPDSNAWEPSLSKFIKRYFIEDSIELQNYFSGLKQLPAWAAPGFLSPDVSNTHGFTRLPRSATDNGFYINNLLKHFPKGRIALVLQTEVPTIEPGDETYSAPKRRGRPKKTSVKIEKDIKMDQKEPLESKVKIKRENGKRNRSIEVETKEPESPTESVLTEAKRRKTRKQLPSSPNETTEQTTDLAAGERTRFTDMLESLENDTEDDIAGIETPPKAPKGYVYEPIDSDSP